jgi:chemotaxis protein CheX
VVALVAALAAIRWTRFLSRRPARESAVPGSEAAKKCRPLATSGQAAAAGKQSPKSNPAMRSMGVARRRFDSEGRLAPRFLPALGFDPTSRPYESRLEAEALQTPEQREEIHVNVEYINPFVDAAVSVFGTMLGVEVRRVGLAVADRIKPEYDITGVIGLSGRASGDVVVSFERNVAISAAGAFLGTKPTQIDETVIDSVGELTNMIAGHAKAALAKLDMRVALPTVITGHGHSIRFTSVVKPICIHFECRWGRLSIQVALAEEETLAKGPGLAAAQA